MPEETDVGVRRRTLKLELEVYEERARAVEDLICEMLRGPHIHRMPADKLADYTVQAGIALHNLPMAVLYGLYLRDFSLLRLVNALDPDAPASGEWGRWATELADAFGVSLPATAGTCGSARR